MKQAIKGEKDITDLHIATFRQIRDYGNGVTHENVWDARVEDIIEIEGKYEQLVDALLAIKSAKPDALLQKSLEGNGGSDRD
ncbi:hypothetical protein N9I56_04825 [Alphaproteobacteria bacterium]|nr:hypothetical protein [Alphaproteobacteria bacterium]